VSTVNVVSKFNSIFDPMDFQITKYKIQITNTPQTQNYKLQKKRRPSGHYTPTATNLERQLLKAIGPLYLWTLEFGICLYFVISGQAGFLVPACPVFGLLVYLECRITFF
jgi:hypothetical protein